MPRSQEAEDAHEHGQKLTKAAQDCAQKDEDLIDPGDLPLIDELPRSIAPLPRVQPFHAFCPRGCLPFRISIGRP